MNSLSHLQRQKRAQRDAAIPDIHGLEEPRELIHECIYLLERIYAGMEADDGESWLQSDFDLETRARRVRNELLALIRSPAWPDYCRQTRDFWRLLQRRKRERILLFCRERSPQANLLLLLGRDRVLNEHFLSGCFPESAFPVLTHSCGQLAGAALRVCDAREPDAFLLTLFEAYPHFDCAVCDWFLEPDEIRAVSRMTRDSPVAFLCPQ